MISRRLVVVLIAFVVLAAGAAVLLPNLKSTSKDTSTDNQATHTTGQKVLSPADVLKNYAKYADKDVSLEGSIYSPPGSNQYYLAPDSGDPTGIIQLDFSKTSLDPARYANVVSPPTQPPTASSHAKGPFTITGKLGPEVKTPEHNPQNEHPVLVVSSIR